MNDDRYMGSVLCHHGVKGMRWGVIRSPEQLGHGPGPGGREALEKDDSSVIMDGDFYKSSKGFVIPKSKIMGYCLKEGSKHADEFFKVGYTKDDPEKLVHDIHNGYDLSKQQEAQKNKRGHGTYAFSMELGVNARKDFTTVWIDDGPGNAPRFVSSYIDRRAEKENDEE